MPAIAILRTPSPARLAPTEFGVLIDDHGLHSDTALSALIRNLVLFRAKSLANISCFHHGTGRLLRWLSRFERKPLSCYDLTKKKMHGVIDTKTAGAQDFSRTRLQILINSTTHICGFQQYNHSNNHHQLDFWSSIFNRSSTQ